jgi:phage baseplate assembly protein gpV
MAKRNRDTNTPETGEQVMARRHDAGSGANETINGLDAIAEELRHAAEDMRCGAGPGKIEKTPVFDRADLAPKI